MGLVEEVGTFLDTQSTRFTLGTNLFLNYAPDETNTVTSIIEYGGTPPDYVFAGEIPQNENQRIAVTCRSTSSVTARANIHAAWVILGGVTNESLSSVSYLRISPLQSPFLLGRDGQHRTEFRCNFDCMRRTTST